LRVEAGLSYPRFLALYMVSSEGADTQRDLAERLGVSEPSVSRMVRVLVGCGWLQTIPDPAGGNRNQLRLTTSGEQLVERWGAELEERFAALLATAGVPYRTYVIHTKRLVAALDAQPGDSRVRGSEVAQVPSPRRSQT
jgi:DNA-binding MarR family transcriptional regulator